MTTWWAELAASQESKLSLTVENIHGVSQSAQVGMGLANVSMQLNVTPVAAVAASTIDCFSTPSERATVMQLAFESPSVTVPLVTGAVPLPVGVGVGVGEGDGLLGDVGDDEGLPVGEEPLPADGVPLADGVPFDDELPPGVGPVAGDGLTAADAPRPASSAALLMLAPAAVVHGPCTRAAAAGLRVSTQSGILLDE